MTDQANIDLVIEAATEAAHNANATLFRSLGVPANDVPFWHDEQDSIKALKREVTKDVLGLPNALTPDNNVNVGNIALYVGIVRAFPGCYGLGVFVDLPQPVFTPAPEPVTVDETTSEAQTGLPEEYPHNDPDSVTDWGAPIPADTVVHTITDPVTGVTTIADNQDINDAAGQPAGTNGQ